MSLVESMVMSYIKGNCLILVALPMTGEIHASVELIWNHVAKCVLDDIENQKALTLARRVDETGSRTIGALRLASWGISQD